MAGRQPDYVPVAPDTSNMIPCRLTGKPFWEIYLYNNPPLWRAYIDAVKHFGFDGWLPDAPVRLEQENTGGEQIEWHNPIVKKTADRIYTRPYYESPCPNRQDSFSDRKKTFYCASHPHTSRRGFLGATDQKDNRMIWLDTCNVYYSDNPPTWGLPLEKAGLPPEAPTEWEEVTPSRNYDNTFQAARDYMGEDGVVGVSVGLAGLSLQPESVYEFYDYPEKVIQKCEEQGRQIIARLKQLIKLKPDFILIGISGFMINNPEPIFRKLSLTNLKEITKTCRDAGVLSQIHCCGPEYALVKMSAQETDLNSINPLEIPPMGDCNLAKIKREFGKKISLMGNLHTTEVMLRGKPEDVERAAKKAIDDAGAGGGFILSTGDQCGRDTPDENIFRMKETARKYGKY